jgi:hypothetical protein
MATNREPATSDEQNSPKVGIGTFVLIIAMVILLYLLGRSMVRHHFHDGGQLNRHSSAQP